VLAASAVNHLKTATPDYREGLVSDERPLSLNPLVGAMDPAVRDVGSLLYRRLLRLDSRAVPVADLASGYTVTPDGLTYQFTLANGQRWSDGRPLSVADVVATVQWVQSPGFGDDATAAPWRDVHVRAAQDGVTFDLAGPRASFPALLTQLPILPIGSLSPSALAALPGKAALAMPSSGPFEAVNSSAAALTLFPNPHAPAQPRLNQIEIDLFASFADAALAFRRGSVDGVLAADPAERAQLVAAGGTAHDFASFGFVDLLFNEREPILADGTVRQSIATAVDRATLVAGPLQGMAIPQVGAIPAGVAWAAPRQAAPLANPTVAASALDADGWSLGSDGVRTHGAIRLQLRLAVADVVPFPQLAVAITSELAAIGVDVQVSSMPTTTLRQRLVNGGFDMALAAWDNGPDPDVSSFWRSTALPPAGFNVSEGPADPFLDQALDRLATLSDVNARIAAAAAVSSQLADDLPAVFLDTPELSLVVRPGIAVSLPPVGTSAARFDDVTSWHRG
jgi:peptide/nickel transport system substrate-binding protein